MNKTETINQFKALRLHGMANAYEAISILPVQDMVSLHEAIARLAEAEAQYRNQQKTQLYLRLSKLRYNCVPDQIKCSSDRNFTKEQLSQLSDCSFIERAENILITGATGSGKSYLACALGRQACTLGYRVLFLSMTKFLEKITQAKLDGSYLKMMEQIDKNHLIILDDFGLQPMDNNSRITLLQMLEDRYEKRSIIITSQLPVNKWYDYINEPTLADAIMDRLSAKANKLELKGISMRVNLSAKNN